MAREPRDHSRDVGRISTALFLVAFVATIAGGLILGSTFVITPPDPLVAAGWGLFGTGLVLSAFFGFRTSRDEGSGVGHATRDGARTLWSWIKMFMP